MSTLTPDQIRQAVDLFQKLTLFLECRPEHLLALAQKLSIRQCPKGSTIIQVKDPSRTLYLLVKGHVSVWRPIGIMETIIAHLRAPDFFGEISMFVKTTATATVKAEEESEVWTLSLVDYETVTKEYPDLEPIIQKNVTIIKARRLWHLNR